MKRVLFIFLLFFSVFAYAEQLLPTQFLNFNGLDIAVYETKGNKGPGILLIHGNTSSASSYSKFFKTNYAKRNRIVAVELPGFGLSDRSVFYDVGFFVDAIVFVAEELNLDEGVLVGWSLGGDLALQASTSLPDLKGIFTFGTAPVGYDPGLPPPFLTPEESYAGEAVNYGFIPDLTNEQIDDYVTAFFRPGFSPIPDFFFDDG